MSEKKDDTITVLLVSKDRKDFNNIKKILYTYSENFKIDIV